MTLNLYLTFALAAFILLVIPGPTILLVIGHALSHGRRAVLPLALGVALGDFTAMTLSLLGLGAVLAASATLFTLFKWLGAAYLVYLGVQRWRASFKPPELSQPLASLSGPGLLRSAYVVTALNPKGIAFFVAFLPQFIRAGEPLLPQLVILEAIFLSLGTLNAALYGLFASRLGETLQQPRARRWLERLGGTTLIGAGVLTAAMKKSAG